MSAAVSRGRRLAGLVGRDKDPPDPAAVELSALMLASEGRPFTADAIDFAARLAKRADVPIKVLAVARIWGTSFGFPNPGLMPTRREWEEQRTSLQRVVWELERKGVEVDGKVVGARNGAKTITRQAKYFRCNVIVMGADEPTGRVRGNFMWTQEPQRVRRLADVPVYLVTPS